MDRRRFLATLSTTVPLAVAGCLGGQDDEPSTTTESTTDQPTTTTTTTTTTQSGPYSVGQQVDLSDDRAIGVAGGDASAFVLTRTDGEVSLHGAADKHYVHVVFNVTNVPDYESLVRDSVTLTIGDQSFDRPLFPLGGGFNQFAAAYAIPNDLTPYSPTVDLDTGDTTATWAFDAPTVSAITQEVDYTVTSLSVPDSVASEGAFTATLTIENAASDPFEFVSILRGTASAPVRLRHDVPANETTSFDIDATAPAADGSDSFDLTLDWAYDAATRTISYE